MKPTHLLTISLVMIFALGPLLPLVRAEDPDDTPVMQEFKRREENARKLSIEDQLVLRGAQQKALADESVKGAIKKRDEVIVEFREKLRAAMIAADPKVKPILDRIAEGGNAALSLGK